MQWNSTTTVLVCAVCKKRTNVSAAELYKPMVTKPARSHQNGRGIWLNKRLFRHRILRFLLLQQRRLRWSQKPAEKPRSWTQQPQSARRIASQQSGPVHCRHPANLTCKKKQIGIAANAPPLLRFMQVSPACRWWPQRVRFLFGEIPCRCHAHWRWLFSLCLFSESDSTPRTLPFSSSQGPVRKKQQGRGSHVGSDPAYLTLATKRVFSHPFFTTWPALDPAPPASFWSAGQEKERAKSRRSRTTRTNAQATTRCDSGKNKIQTFSKREQKFIFRPSRVPCRCAVSHSSLSNPLPRDLRPWVESGERIPHQLLGDASSMSSLPVLPARPNRTPCTDSLRQHVRGVLYKSPGRSLLEVPLHSGREHSGVGSAQPELAESSKLCRADWTKERICYLGAMSPQRSGSSIRRWFGWSRRSLAGPK